MSPMPRTTKDIIDQSEELAARFEVADSTNGHVDAVAQLRDAIVARVNGEAAVVDAIANARAVGMSWSAIGVLVGTSGEAARQRFGA